MTYWLTDEDNRITGITLNPQIISVWDVEYLRDDTMAEEDDYKC
jgi:hypothetical protein